MNQEQLLTYINQVSFVVSDMLLYLDTHPTDREALAYCEDHIAMRNKALKEYAALYGPLTIDTADDAFQRMLGMGQHPLALGREVEIVYVEL